MTHQTSSRTRRAIVRVRHIWAELDYAQRRMFEITTGVSAPRRDANVDELEAGYARPAR